MATNSPLGSTHSQNFPSNTNSDQVRTHESTDTSRPMFQPAKVSLTSHSGNQININIGKISGNVSVGNRNTMTYVTEGPQRPIKKQVYTVGDLNAVCYDDSSDSETDSSSDSDVDRWFGEAAGGPNPSRTVREAMKTRKRSTQQTATVMNQLGSVHTLVMKPGQAPEAYDINGRRTELKSQSVNLKKASTTHICNNLTQVNGGAHTETVRRESQPSQATSSNKALTIEQIMRGVDQHDRLVDVTVIRKINSHFGASWRRVFRHLDLSDSVIDMQHQDSAQVQDTVYKLLIHWTQSCEKPTLRCLIEALVWADQYDVIKVLKQMK